MGEGVVSGPDVEPGQALVFRDRRIDTPGIPIGPGQGVLEERDDIVRDRIGPKAQKGRDEVDPGGRIPAGSDGLFRRSRGAADLALEERAMALIIGRSGEQLWNSRQEGSHSRKVIGGVVDRTSFERAEAPEKAGST